MTPAAHGTPVVAVLAGRGKTGRAVSRALAAAGARVRPLGRADLVRPEEALAGCTAVYLMAPNLHPDEAGYAATVLAAAQRVGVRRVVHHSVAAPYAPAMPHHLGKARAEDLVRRSGLAWTILQPCAYVQNLVPGLCAEPPAVRVPYDPDRTFGLVDLRDVAAAAATVLLDDPVLPDPVLPEGAARGSHVGATYELGGPHPVSARDVAGAASVVLGRPVPCERLAVEEAVSGVDDREASWLRAMFDHYDRHGLPTGPLPLRVLLGRGASDLAATLGRELAAPEASAPAGTDVGT